MTTAANKKTARHSVNCPGQTQEERAPMPANRTPAPQVPPTSARTPTPRTVLRKLNAAVSRLDVPNPAPDEIRKAQALTAAAAAMLDELVQRIAEQDAEGHRRHAIKQAKVTKDVRGYKRAPVTMPGYHRGRVSPVKGRRFEPTPPNVNDILRMLAAAPEAVMATRGKCLSCGKGEHLRERHTANCRNASAERTRAAILLLWRGGFRVGCELTRLRERDLHPDQGYIHVANGKGGKARDVVIDDWVWPMLEPWLAFRQAYPVGPLFCVIEGPTAGVARWTDTGVRRTLHGLAEHVGIRYRVNPHAFRHAMTLEQVLEGIPEIIVSRNLGHADLGVTSQYLRTLPQSRVHSAIRSRPMPQISMTEALENEGVSLKRSTTPDLMGVLAAATPQRELMAA